MLVYFQYSPIGLPVNPKTLAPWTQPAAAKRPKSESSSAGGGAGNTVQEMWRKMTQREHILHRPDTYLDSMYTQTNKLWVYEDGGMVQRDVTYVPSLYKIFDEILVSAADNKRRHPSMNSLRVDIDVQDGRISVYNNGCGLPVEIHPEEGVYVPEVMFGHPLTTCRYDHGVKLTNIFSTELIIETADGRRQQKKYKQVLLDCFLAVAYS